NDILACCAWAGATLRMARHAASGAPIRTSIIFTSRHWRRPCAPPSGGHNTGAKFLFRSSEARLLSQISTGFSRVLRIGDRLKPGYMFAGLCFLHRKMFHTVFGGRTVPMFLSRRDPDGIAGPDFTHRSAPGLDPADT